MRNLAITGGVALSIITAPVVAAVSVGKKTFFYYATFKIQKHSKDL